MSCMMPGSPGGPPPEGRGGHGHGYGGGHDALHGRGHHCCVGHPAPHGGGCCCCVGHSALHGRGCCCGPAPGFAGRECCSTAGFPRRFIGRREMVEELERYIEELKKELAAAEERLEHIQENHQGCCE